MEVTIDISMYPNKEDFIPPIKRFYWKNKLLWRSKNHYLPNQHRSSGWIQPCYEGSARNHSKVLWRI